MQEKCSQSIRVAAAALPSNAGKVFRIYHSGYSRFASDCRKCIHSLFHQLPFTTNLRSTANPLYEQMTGERFASPSMFCHVVTTVTVLLLHRCSFQGDV